MQPESLYFVSKEASWQKYRYDILTKLGKNNGIRVEILTTGKLKSYLKDNKYVTYKIFKSWLPHAWKPSFFPGALLYILKKRPSAVLCIIKGTQFTEYASLLLCKLLGVRFIWWTHAYDHGLPNRKLILKKLKEKYIIFFLKRGDSIITFSEKGTSYLITHGISPQKIFTALNTLDTDALLEQRKTTRLAKSKESLLNELGMQPQDKIILFSGRFYDQKKLEDLINAVPYIASKEKNAKLCIIGGGDRMSELQLLAKQKAPYKIFFLGEIFDNTLLAKWFSASTLYVIPGCVGLGIVHAFCFGLPIITERVKTHGPEIQYLHDGYNGYFVNEGDIPGLGQRIIDLLNDSKRLIRFSQNAIKTAETEANIKHMIEQMSRAIGLAYQ